jgi:hypothetical protein
MNSSMVSLGCLFSSHFLSNFTLHWYMSAIVSLSYFKLRALLVGRRLDCYRDGVLGVIECLREVPASLLC